MIVIYKSADEFSGAIKPFVNSVNTDVLGNIVAHKQGIGNRIMLVAHRDVVRLMVTHIDNNGFLYMKPSGSIDISILQARKVIIRHKGKNYVGIIGKKPIHLLRDEQNCKITYENLWVDIGAKNHTEALQMVSEGDYVYFCGGQEYMPNNLVASSYIDNSVGLNVLVELAKRLPSASVSKDIYFVASNHEEIGMRGASVIANRIKPDVCICIDVTHAADYPMTNAINDGDISLGEGCVLSKGPNIHSDLFNSLEEIAIKKSIKYQIEVSPYPTGTDANPIQISGEGIKTAVVSVPCRYMHTPHEICSVNDMESATEILREFIFSNESAPKSGY